MVPFFIHHGFWFLVSGYDGEDDIPTICTSIDDYLQRARDLHTLYTLSRGKIGTLRIQRFVVPFVILRCGRDLFKYILSPGNRYKKLVLRTVLEEARAKVSNMVSIATIRRWVYYFINHIEIKPSQPGRRRSPKKGHRNHRNYFNFS